MIYSALYGTNQSSSLVCGCDSEWALHMVRARMVHWLHAIGYCEIRDEHGKQSSPNMSDAWDMAHKWVGLLRFQQQFMDSHSAMQHKLGAALKLHPCASTESCEGIILPFDLVAGVSDSRQQTIAGPVASLYLSHDHGPWRGQRHYYGQSHQIMCL